ncbi:MAG TPA: alpha-glucan family phosphorylase [Synergistaceae bacterium]|nr:alpha-glucan family phosphorylase [Synergistaceae bacterium]
MANMIYGNDISRSLRYMMEQDPAFRTVAYFSMEVGIKQSIPTYAGGLGVLAGDILKSAADLGVPMAGVTLLYRKGYFRQTFSDCRQKEEPVDWNPADELTLLPNEVTVIIEGREVKVRAWSLEIEGKDEFVVPVYFLDTDVETNAPQDRQLSWYLYGGDIRYRLCQEIVLGSGGLRMLRDLGYANIEKFHLNEGHAAFLLLELLREQGYESYERIREQGVFTTHTPVSAGHDYFSWDLINSTMNPSMARRLRRMMPTDSVSMTDIALRYSRYVNGVSKKHAEVSRGMYLRNDVDCITNGIHTDTWVSPEMADLFDRHITGWRNAPERLVYAMNIPPKDIWQAHQKAKRRLLDEVRGRTGRILDPDRLTIGFARRAAQYKRADLILKDVKRLVEIGSGKVQFVFSGKAHPQDEGGKAMVSRLLCEAQNMVGTDLPIVFLEDYGMELGALLVQGVDLWLNNPIRPMEASGTSGMKCAANGVPSFSVLDGWWIEGWVEGVTGWSIGALSDENGQDDPDSDADDLYNKLENVVIPAYYQNREQWMFMMRYAIALNGSYFNTHRVVREYCERAYGISFRGL